MEQAVALADLHGFVLRDKEWVTPTESQVLGFMDVDYEKNAGTFSIDLPMQPRGTLSDVDNNGKIRYRCTDIRCLLLAELRRWSILGRE